MGEQEIVELLLQKSEQGMDALLLHYGPLMKYIIAPIVKSPQDREDCLSEAAMRVWDKIEQFRHERGSWSAWLTAVTRNTALNYARKNFRHGSAEDLSEDLPSPALTPEEIVLQKERRDAVEHALNHLSAKDRLLFYRKYYYRQSTAQIASELGLSERAVEGKLYRLKKQLRRMLGGEDCD
ncbi:MAG: sigma-70 family RNA polymerase sigma factor [Acutalibacter sp.]|nr:sigma-70 family RNA polymerase sigma factor [Acutalibacter sp.]